MFRELIDEIDTNIKMNEDYSNEYDELESNITKDIALKKVDVVSWIEKDIELIEFRNSNEYKMLKE